MIKVFVDSGSSIKQHEKEKYNVEILPLKINLNNKDYLDGVDLTNEVFYEELIINKQFPKTSLPSLIEAEEKVLKCVEEGDDVIIITISSGISGTYNALRMHFSDEPKVHVIDSKTAVGGIKILVHEINRHRDQPIEKVLDIVNNLIPRIRVYAVPETLAYLHRGGRLSKVEYAAATLLRIKPIIELRDKVKVSAKPLGLPNAMNKLIEKLNDCDTNYPIVPSYTYNSKNLDKLIANTKEEYQKVMIEKDDLDLAIAAHWGPRAFGYIYVKKDK